MTLSLYLNRRSLVHTEGVVRMADFDLKDPELKDPATKESAKEMIKFNVIVKVIYCPTCTMPIEFCEFGACYDKVISFQVIIKHEYDALRTSVPSMDSQTPPRSAERRCLSRRSGKVPDYRGRRWWIRGGKAACLECNGHFLIRSCSLSILFIYLSKAKEKKTKGRHKGAAALKAATIYDTKVIFLLYILFWSAPPTHSLWWFILSAAWYERLWSLEFRDRSANLWRWLRV